MKAKHQRLLLALLALAAMIGAVLLAMSAMKDKAAYFYSPGDIQRDHVPPGRTIRLGGMVADKSIVRDGDGTTVRFVVTDATTRIPVTFHGITPDLFKENSGVIAEGTINPDGSFAATNLLAKHDEKYMPPQMAGAQHKTGQVSR